MPSKIQGSVTVLKRKDVNVFAADMEIAVTGNNATAYCVYFIFESVHTEQPRLKVFGTSLENLNGPHKFFSCNSFFIYSGKHYLW